MNILGLHFGHDGGVAVVCDGVPKIVLLTERVSRIKHGVWIDESMIDDALSCAGLTIDDIDYCAISTTQGHPVVTLKAGRLKVRYGRHATDTIPSAKEERFGGQWQKLMVSESHRRRKSATILEQKRYQEWDPRNGTVLPIHRAEPADLDLLFLPESLIVAKHIESRKTLDDMARTTLSGHILDDSNRYTCHAPMTVEFDGRTIAGVHVEHHACHAAGAYYQSGLKSAAVFTFDGADYPQSSSDAFVGIGSALYRIVRPQLWLGSFYNAVAISVGVGQAGKLMGLSPYGQPAYFDRAFIGTTSELGFDDHVKLSRTWLARALKQAETDGLDLGLLGKSSHVLDRINTDLAASAQKTFEENVAAFVKVAKAVTDTLPSPVEGLCISGGCALSCPTNTRAANEGGFARVFVEPACDDSGLCVGAALWVHHNLLNHPLLERDAAYPMSPYLGKTYDITAIEKALRTTAGDLTVANLGSRAPSAAAADLANNAIVGWFEGRSEIGPRALGHRSILADPRVKDNWDRTNRIKGREGWRPFAPSVLEEDATRWFKDMPLPSPYMLFTGNVIEPGALPAIAHVDGTARVQTVNPSVGGYYNVLKEFQRATDGCSVVLNTSLNGPGEPIVETAEEAISFLKTADLDAIYIDSFRVSKN